MDTPGIEPGAFRLQSGRATTALRARAGAAEGPQLHTLQHPQPLDSLEYNVPNTPSKAQRLQL